jgi:hypothetical protein
MLNSYGRCVFTLTSAAVVDLIDTAEHKLMGGGLRRFLFNGWDAGGARASPPLIHSGCCKSCSNKHTAPESWDASSCRVVGAKAYFAWDGSGLFVLILFIVIFFWWVTRLVGKSVIYWVIPYMLNDVILALYDYCWSNNSALRFTHTFMHAFFPPVAALPAERTPLSFLFFFLVL